MRENFFETVATFKFDTDRYTQHVFIINFVYQNIFNVFFNIYFYSFFSMQVFDIGPEGGDQEIDGDVLIETDEIPYECGARLVLIC